MSQEENHGISKSLLSPLIFIFLDSIKLIFIQNPNLFFFIYAFGALPLSLFITSLSLSSTSRFLKSHIVRLEFLYRVVDIWIEAGNVRETSELDLIRLYRFKLAHSVPIVIFSLFTAVSVVTAVTNSSAAGSRRFTSTSAARSRPGLRAAFAALRSGWYRTLTTSMVSVMFWVALGHLTPLLTAAVSHHHPGWSIIVLAASEAVEVYGMTVVAVAIVVSAAEEGRYGIEAIRVGSGLMKGRRVIGWVISGLILLSTNCIGREMVGVMDGGDWGKVNEGEKWTVEIKVSYFIGLVLLLGWLIMWSYVVITVFYCDCRKRFPVIIRQDDPELLDGN